MGLDDGDPEGVTSALRVRNTGALGRAKQRSPKLGVAKGLAMTGMMGAEEDTSKGFAFEAPRKECAGVPCG